MHRGRHVIILYGIHGDGSARGTLGDFVRIHELGIQLAARNDPGIDSDYSQIVHY